ncbi:hypothetical protein FALCPG4_003463 [Fusarium falciforme]
MHHIEPGGIQSIEPSPSLTLSWRQLLYPAQTLAKRPFPSLTEISPWVWSSDIHRQEQGWHRTLEARDGKASTTGRSTGSGCEGPLKVETVSQCRQTHSVRP